MKIACPKCDFRPTQNLLWRCHPGCVISMPHVLRVPHFCNARHLSALFKDVARYPMSHRDATQSHRDASQSHRDAAQSALPDVVPDRRLVSRRCTRTTTDSKAGTAGPSQSRDIDGLKNNEPRSTPRARRLKRFFLCVLRGLSGSNTGLTLPRESPSGNSLSRSKALSTIQTRFGPILLKPKPTVPGTQVHNQVLSI